TVNQSLQGAGVVGTGVAQGNCLAPTDGNAFNNKPYASSAFPATAQAVNIYICYTYPGGSSQTGSMGAPPPDNSWRLGDINVSLQQAANEGARVAVHDSDYVDPNGVGCTPPANVHCWPTDADVASAVQAHAVTEVLANPCPNGPIPNGGNPQGSLQVPPANTGWIFITDPSPGGNPPPTANGPRGGLGTLPPPGPGCYAIQPAIGTEPIKVT